MDDAGKLELEWILREYTVVSEHLCDRLYTLEDREVPETIRVALAQLTEAITLEFTKDF